MGYPMTYGRVISRNDLGGDYRPLPGQPQLSERVNRTLVCGDLRRLEKDQRDDWHLMEYAIRTGLSPAQVLHVLDLFFEGNF